jgi:serine phosphatase RsbU (regulator of sigma subunit)
MPKTTSIRKSLLINMLLLIVILSAAMITINHFASRKTVRTLSGSLINQTIGLVEVELMRFFDPVIDELMLVRSWGESGMLDIENPKALNLLLAPLIEEHSQISSLLIADERGKEHMLLKTGEKWINRQSRADEWKGRSKWLEWTKGDPEKEAVWKKIKYDTRTRPWYKGALDARKKGGIGTVHWTTPYTFFTTKDPGITASVTYSSGDGLTHVIGFDVLLNKISKFTTGLKVSKNGKVVILTGNDQIIGLPSGERFNDEESIKEALLKPGDEIGIGILNDAAAAFTARGREDKTRGAMMRFFSDGEPWWGETKPFKLSDGLILWIVVLVPEYDLLGSIASIRGWIIFITLAVLMLALIRAVAMSQRYSEPIEKLVQQSERIREGDLDRGDAIKSSLSEVLKLAEAQDRMRTGLKSLFKLERDLQIAQQIQRQTFPRSMPELKGFEIDAWNKPADRTGGDTYDVIGFSYASDGEQVMVSEDKADYAMLLLADATGHGVGPALSVSQVRAMLRMAVRTNEALTGIGSHINDQLFADLYDGRFITAWLGRLDANENKLTSFSAGQAPLIRYTASDDRFEVLNADASPFGVLDKLNIKTNCFDMAPGDIFAVISDGIFEATNPDGERFETERTIEVLSSVKGETPKIMIETLRERVDEFTRGLEAKDDRTMLIIKRV